jgi:hypothetical protein
MNESVGRIKIVWGKPEIITPGVLSAEMLSVTTGSDIPGDTAFPLSALFNVQVGLPGPAPVLAVDYGSQAAASAPSVASWAGAFRVPITLEQDTSMYGVWYKSDLRFFVQKDEGARALLVADLEGETFVRELPFGEKAEAESITQSFVHQAKLLPVSYYTASFFLFVERRSSDSSALLQLDSLDVEVNPNFRPQTSDKEPAPTG